MGALSFVRNQSSTIIYLRLRQGQQHCSKEEENAKEGEGLLPAATGKISISTDINI
jgi:hypothetical protein